MSESIINHRELFGSSIRWSVGTAAKLLSSYPASASAFLRIAGRLGRSEKLRAKNLETGVEVPPLLIVSTTEECNLSCAGCYACARGKSVSPTLGAERIEALLNEASGLGVSIVMLAGGEPLLSRGWLEALGEHRELLGIVFTNGTLLDETRLSWFEKHRHVIPVISIEGGKSETDARRGDGMHDIILSSMARLYGQKIPFGLSLTATTDNIGGILSGDFIDGYAEKGCRLFFFVEYVPVAPDTGHLVLSQEQKHSLVSFCSGEGDKHGAFLFPFPGYEDDFSGCLAAGRGFVHISASGDLEPCPFAPFSDVNLSGTGLREALSSKVLAAIRENHHLLKEGDGGCALWSNRDFVSSILEGA